MEETDLIGPLSSSLALEAAIDADHRPLIFPTSDDQAAGLAGGGAVDAGQVAVILGNSAVVNSSSAEAPASGRLDAMRLNWGPYLWMRCYNNGAQFLDRVVGERPEWEKIEREARACPVGAGGAAILPFASPEPSLGVRTPRLEWLPSEPMEAGRRFRASLEALAYLIALAVKEHEAAGQKITRITVSGGIARSDLMCEVLASVLDRPLEQRCNPFEGPALGGGHGAWHGGWRRICDGGRESTNRLPRPTPWACWSSSVSRQRRIRRGARRIRKACGRLRSGCKRSALPAASASDAFSAQTLSRGSCPRIKKKKVRHGQISRHPVPRRLRGHPLLRNLVRETTLSPSTT